jgi:hypothetical protein
VKQPQSFAPPPSQIAVEVAFHFFYSMLSYQ